jgi:hypothetical protein
VIDGGWLTNDPIVAQKLRAADRAWMKAKAQAANLTLAEKVKALERAKAARIAAYREAHK